MTASSEGVDIIEIDVRVQMVAIDDGGREANIKVAAKSDQLPEIT